MMPMAGQDAVLDAASFQRETHVRTAIVEREDLSALVYEQDGRWRPCTTIRPLSLNSSRVPARTKSEVALSIDASCAMVGRSAIQQRCCWHVNPATAAWSTMAAHRLRLLLPALGLASGS